MDDDIDSDWPASPASALQLLVEGNKRFVAGERQHPHQDADRRAALAPAQRPFAVLFGCSDSRLAAETRRRGPVMRRDRHAIGPPIPRSADLGRLVSLEAGSIGGCNA